MTLAVEWTAGAMADLRAITWQDAAWIAAEVARYAEHGIGDMAPTLCVWRVARAVLS